MKKFFTLTMLALLSLGVQAQDKKTWDFSKGWSDETLENLEKGSEWTKDGSSWKETGKFGSGAFVANGEPIKELEGLMRSSAGLSKNNNYLLTSNTFRLNRNNQELIFPNLKNGQKLTIVGRSANATADNRGVKGMYDYMVRIDDDRDNNLILGSNVDGSKGTYTFVYEIQTNETEAVPVGIKMITGGIDFTLFMIDDGDPIVTTKVAYLYTGSTDGDIVFNYLKARENTEVTAIDVANETVTEAGLREYGLILIAASVPADNAAVNIVKAAMPWTPTLNMNASLYPAWGYGEAVEAQAYGVVKDSKSALLSGIEILTSDDISFVPLGSSESTIYTVQLGDYFKDDAKPLVGMSLEGEEFDGAVAHIHNEKHNAYVYLPSPADMTEDMQKIIENAITLLNESKAEITKTVKPVITQEYKDNNTNVIITAGRSLPKTRFFYTTDGSDPTTESTEYTEKINLTTPCTLKAVAIAEGYLLSDVTEANAQIFDQPATPDISATYEEGKTIVTLSCETPDVDIWYNFSGIANDTTKSMKYAEPITFTLPSDFIAYAVAGKQVYSEPASQRIVVKDVIVRQDQIGLFDANATDFQNGGGSTVYYFSWGKNPVSIYDTTADPIGTNVDPDTGDETAVYPERDYEYYVPTTEDESVTYPWEVKSKGQVMIWQSLTTGSDPGNENDYNPETAGDILSYAKITNNDVQFGGKASGEPCTGAIQSRVKFAGPFDIATVVGTAAGGENVGRMQIQVSKDSVEWTNVGEEMTTSTVKRLWKTHVRSYNETDEVYVRIIQAGGGSSVQIFNMYILNEGEKSLELKNQYNQEYEEAITGIQNIQNTTKAAMGIYNLNGMRQQNMVRGLNIVVNGDGTVKKVLVK